jgi:sRNA-binding carbon storage regulator CsrA
MALVLTQRTGDRITMTTRGGEEIVLELLFVRLGAAQLSLEAPKTVDILRHNAVLRTPKPRGER